MAAERFECLTFILLVILSEILVPWAVRGKKTVGKQVKENEYQQVVHQNSFESAKSDYATNTLCIIHTPQSCLHYLIKNDCKCKHCTILATSGYQKGMHLFAIDDGVASFCIPSQYGVGV